MDDSKYNDDVRISIEYDTIISFCIVGEQDKPVRKLIEASNSLTFTLGDRYVWASSTFLETEV